MADLLAALNTGHEGGCCTVHANDAADVPARFEALAGMAGLGRAAVHSQLAAALDAVVHIRRRRDGHRYVASVGVVEATADGLVAVVDAVRGDGQGGVHAGPGWARLRALLDRRDLDSEPVDAALRCR